MKPTCSHVKQMIREWVLMNESSKPPRAYVPVMEDAVCMAVPVPDRAPPKGWRGLGVRAGGTGSIPPRCKQSKSLRGRELLNRMQDGSTEGYTVHGVHPAFSGSSVLRARAVSAEGKAGRS
jgi:hypothetical protein